MVAEPVRSSQIGLAEKLSYPPFYPCNCEQWDSSQRLSGKHIADTYATLKAFESTNRVRSYPCSEAAYDQSYGDSCHYGPQHGSDVEHHADHARAV